MYYIVDIQDVNVFCEVILRPGRLEVQIENGRQQMFEIHTRSMIFKHDIFKQTNNVTNDTKIYINPNKGV